MIGWIRAPTPTPRSNSCCRAVRDLPETGRLTGRGDTLNLERLIAAKPDLVIDFGSINDTYRSLADRVQAQTGIPYRADRRALRQHAGGAAPRRRHPRRQRARRDAGARMPRRPSPPSTASLRACRPTSGRASIWRAARRVWRPARAARSTPRSSSGSGRSMSPRACGGKGGIANGLAGAGHRLGARHHRHHRPRFQVEREAASRHGTGARSGAEGSVFLAPSLPYGLIDSPPSVNRLIGLTLAAADALSGRRPGIDLRADRSRLLRAVLRRRRSTDADLDRLLGGRWQRTDGARAAAVVLLAARRSSSLAPCCWRAVLGPYPHRARRCRGRDHRRC